MSEAKSSMRTPLGRVRGLGSAKSGTEHFWMQRVTAVANVPLTIFVVGLIISTAGSNYAAVKATLGSPIVAIPLILFVISVTWHMRLGMQIIIEDYVPRARKSCFCCSTPSSARRLASAPSSPS